MRTIASDCWSHCEGLRRGTLGLKPNPNSFQDNLGKPRNPLPLTSQPQAEKQVPNLLITRIWLALILSNIVSKEAWWAADKHHADYVFLLISCQAWRGFLFDSLSLLPFSSCMLCSFSSGSESWAQRSNMPL